MESTEAQQEQQQVKPFKVVVGIDFSPPSTSVLRSALALANCAPRSAVHVAAVADYDRTAFGLYGLSSEHTPSDAMVKLQELTKTIVDEFADAVGDVHLERVMTHLLTGAPASELVWLAAHVDADLLVVGTHGRKGIPRLLLGSVAERVVRTAGCPVYIVREKHHEQAWQVPEIEPPCPECLSVRRASGGEKLWCDRHESHVHAHVYSGEGAASQRVRSWGFDT